MIKDKTEREIILKKYTEKKSEIETLLQYNENHFDHFLIDSDFKFFLKNESFVDAWDGYKHESAKKGVFNTLKEKIIQFNFPVEQSTSESDDYKEAVLKGVINNATKKKNSLALNKPDQLELLFYQSPFGNLPIIITHDRDDFCSLIQAIAYKNEPVILPASMGAMMISGYNNWDRINSYKNKWTNKNPEKKWEDEFERMIQHKELYQDKFIIISDGNYSNIKADELSISEKEWKDHSIKIRIAHEYTHYFTKRVLSSMRNNLLDELIADYAGIVNTLGCYKVEWFLKFMGIEKRGSYRKGGRLENYIDKKNINSSVFNILKKLCFDASLNIEKFQDENYDIIKTENFLFKMILTLSYFTLEELASINSTDLIKEKFSEINTQWKNFFKKQ